MKSHRHRPWRAFLAVATASLTSAALAGGCGSDNALVGGDCATGFTACNDQCVDLMTDPLNCGACGHVCPAAVACVEGACGGNADGSFPPDAARDGAGSDAGRDATGADAGDGATSNDGATTDGTTTDGAGNDGSANDGATTDGASTDGGVSDGAVDDGAMSDGAMSDATSTDGAVGDGASTDAATDGAVGDGASTDAASDGAVDDGATDAGVDACVPPFNTPQACGDCFTQCVAPNDSCVAVDGGFACAPSCPTGQTLCNGACVDTTTDEFNCGSCNNFCPTFICQNSMCVGSLPGEVMLIGHDYATAIPYYVPQARVLTNSVFTRTVPTLRVLAYERYADAKSVSTVTSILQTYGTAAARPIVLTATSNDNDIPSTLNTSSYDVLLVLDEPSAPAGALGTLGTSWQSTVSAYVQAGGVVVVLDGATAPEMPSFITNAGLLNVTSQTQIPPSTQVVNTAPGDTVGNGVASPYRVTNHSSRFSADPASSNVTYVIFDQTDNEPVVIHRTN